MEANNCVYFLRDPRTGYVGYVGISHEPEARLIQHWRNKQGSNDAKSCWFRQLKKLGLKPEMHVVLSGLSRQQAIRAESGIIQSWVRSGRAKELHQCTNQQVFFRSKEEALPFLEKRFLQCSPSCRRAVIAHLQGLPS